MFCSEEHCCNSFPCFLFNGIIIILFSFITWPSWHFCEVTTLLKEQNHPFSRRMKFQRPSVLCRNLTGHVLQIVATRPGWQAGDAQEGRSPPPAPGAPTRTMAVRAQWSKPTTEFSSIQLTLQESARWVPGAVGAGQARFWRELRPQHILRGIQFSSRSKHSVIPIKCLR